MKKIALILISITPFMSTAINMNEIYRKHQCITNMWATISLGSVCTYIGSKTGNWKHYDTKIITRVSRYSATAGIVAAVPLVSSQCYKVLGKL